MYNEFFGFREAPFTIAPDPRYLFLSERHKEALAHLLYGVSGQGGFVVLTGEVGTGKTTLCRRFLQEIPHHVDIALVFNPKVSAQELLATICRELGLPEARGLSIMELNNQLNDYLLKAHAAGRHTLVVIDEAQNLSVEVLEQVRLLTNLETPEKKLLQIALLGQPELSKMLDSPQLRQLSQRITARYHLDRLNRQQTFDYIAYRLSVAGQRGVIFSRRAVGAVYRSSRGTPRLINLICDRSLLGAYTRNAMTVDAATVRRAAREIHGDVDGRLRLGRLLTRKPTLSFVLGIFVLTLTGGVLVMGLTDDRLRQAPAAASDAGERPPAVVAVEGVGSQSGPEGKPDVESMGQIEQQVSAGDRGDTRLTLNSLTEDASRADAYAALFNAWGYDYRRDRHGLACDYGQVHGLGCLHRQGSWNRLAVLDRPAVLELINREGKAVSVALLSLERDRAQLKIGGELQWYARETVEAAWFGDYSLLWRLPPWESRSTESGTPRNRQFWLHRALREAEKRLSLEAGSSRGDLESRVAAFQRREGLRTDGVVGPVTIIRLNHYLGRPAPTLSGASEGDLNEPAVSLSDPISG